MITAVLPIRNRPARRIVAAGETIRRSGLTTEIEIIVSDFGSDNSLEIQEAANSIGARYFRQEANYWNKPKCLNRAIEISTGSLILCADIDIIWAPGAVENGVRTLLSGISSRRRVLAFQSRDLAPSLTDKILQAPSEVDWNALERESIIHSTWGNGILLFSKSLWQEIGGYDERLGVYGVEDLDFCRRLQFAGAKFVWASSEKAQIYHVWHPRVERELPEKQFSRAIERNRKIWRTDLSVVRNLRDSLQCGDPLVSVVIATAGRKAFLQEAIASVLCQTVQDFEIIVVDDGQLDDSQAVVAGFEDARIRYFGLSEPRGISYARNLGGRHARGKFIAVMDDDDICLPDRLEVSIASITGGVDGCVGGFITFHEEDGKVVSWDDPLPSLEGAFAQGGFAGHPTWMVRREVLNCFSYEESFTSAVDNNLALRMLNSGVNLVHTGKPHVLRRVHDGQVSNQDQQFQGYGARLDKTWLWTGYKRKDWANKVSESKQSVPRNRALLGEKQFLPYLPDALVRREVDACARNAEQRELLHSFGLINGFEVKGDGEFIFGKYRIEATWKTMACLSQLGIDYVVAVTDPTSKLTDRIYESRRPEFAYAFPWRELAESGFSALSIRTLDSNTYEWSQVPVTTKGNGCFSMESVNLSISCEKI